MGGEWFNGLFGDPGSVHEDTLSQIALEELNRQIGITAPPSFINTAILRDSIAQYTVGHSDKLSEQILYCDMICLVLSVLCVQNVVIFLVVSSPKSIQF